MGKSKAPRGSLSKSMSSSSFNEVCVPVPNPSPSPHHPSPPPSLKPLPVPRRRPFPPLSDLRYLSSLARGAGGRSDSDAALADGQTGSCEPSLGTAERDALDAMGGRGSSRPDPPALCKACTSLLDADGLCPLCDAYPSDYEEWIGGRGSEEGREGSAEDDEPSELHHETDEEEHHHDQGGSESDSGRAFHTLGCSARHRRHTGKGTGREKSPHSHPSFQPCSFCQLLPVTVGHTVCRSCRHRRGWGRRRWWFGPVLDPRSRSLKIWSRVYVAVMAISLVADPCFLYTLSFSSSACVFIQGIFAVFLAVVRSACDALYLVQSSLVLRTAYVSRESMVLGRGELVFDARAIALNHLTSWGGLFLDAVVVLPVPQILVFVLLPKLMEKTRTGNATALSDGFTLLLAGIFIQYILKLCHTVVALTRSQRVNGVVFGTSWWGFCLNLLVYVIAAHGFGALWYLFTVQQALRCLADQCEAASDPPCSNGWLTCTSSFSSAVNQATPLSPAAAAWGNSDAVQSSCFGLGPSYDYGIFNLAVQLLQWPVALEKIMLGLFFGIMTMSTFGNALIPTSSLLQSIFSLIMVVSGLLLLTLLIGNIEVFLRAITARISSMHLRRQDLDWWMRRRQLPPGLQQRVRRQERQMFAATRGVQEDELLSGLPDSLQRDVKRHLCVDLVRRVPLFEAFDDSVIDNICARLQSVALIPGTEVVRQGEPVEEMLFIVKGRLRSTHEMTSGEISVCHLGPGLFSGEELLTWALSRSPDEACLPKASSSLDAVTLIEAFSLQSSDLCFITTHFRFSLRTKKLRQLIRYYSPHWRTWAAVTIQLAWRRYRASKGKGSFFRYYTARPRKHTSQAGVTAMQSRKMGGSSVQGMTSTSTSITPSQSSGLNHTPSRGPLTESARYRRLKLYGALIRAPKPPDDADVS